MNIDDTIQKLRLILNFKFKNSEGRNDVLSKDFQTTFPHQEQKTTHQDLQIYFAESITSNFLTTKFLGTN